ncbi:DNA recombination protein RmuC [Dyella sp. 20L07]|uniref:DNA recombination protein RmuC n=1 Tax=Dyella sp. 20L07 TaxID=3384240 RepID=UPI003D2D2C92
MEGIPVWGWLLLGLIVVGALVMTWMARHDLSSVQASLRSVQGEAGRLPDVLDRAGRAEGQVAELLQAVKDGAVREATLSARADENKNLYDQAVQASDKYESLYSDLRSKEDLLKQKLASSDAALETIRAQLSQIRNERDTALDDVKNSTEQLRILGEESAKAKAERDAALSSLEETKKFLKDAEALLRTSFTEAASKVFDEKSLALDQRIKDSAEVSKKGFEETLKPFAERVVTFQTKIEQFTTDQAKEHATLVGTIGELKTLNQNMADATGALTKALKGNAKVRGDWGELILDTVLKASGLEEGRDYERQAQSSDEDTGEKGRPDIVINLPDGRRVVVDSKVNLVAWSDAQNAETSDAQQDALYRHVAALRQHVRDLSDKNYPKILGKDALDMTVLFVPIEGALSAALTVNADLQMEAFSKKVVFASPNTLMAMLRVVERLWTRDKLQKQVDTIGVEAGKLMDSLISFLDDFQSIENRLKQAGDAYVTAKNRLSESPQSVMARGRRLVEAGVKGRKALPEELKPIAGSDSIPLIDQAEKEV